MISSSVVIKSRIVLSRRHCFGCRSWLQKWKLYWIHRL